MHTPVFQLPDEKMSLRSVTVTAQLPEGQQRLVEEPVSDSQVIPYLLRRRQEGVRIVREVVQFASSVGRSFDELLRDASSVLSAEDLLELTLLRTEFDNFIISVRKFSTATAGRIRRLRAPNANLGHLIAHLQLGVEEERSNELSDEASRLATRVTQLLTKVERAAGQQSTLWKKIASISTAIAVVGVLIVVTGGVAAIPAAAFVFPHALLASGMVAAGAGGVMAAVASAYAGRDRQEIVQFLRAMQGKLKSLRLRLADLEAHLNLGKEIDSEYLVPIDDILADLDTIRAMTE